MYKARDPLIDRLVIIKTLAVGLPNDEGLEFRKRLDRELKIRGRLSHPNLVTIYDVGVTGDIVYIATEFIDGRSLHDVLRGGRLMPAGPQRLPRKSPTGSISCTSAASFTGTSARTR